MAPWPGGGCNTTVGLGGVGRGGVGVAEGFTCKEEMTPWLGTFNVLTAIQRKLTRGEKKTVLLPW